MRLKVVPQQGGGVTFFLKNEFGVVFLKFKWSHFTAWFFLFNLTPKQDFSIDAN